MRRGRRHPISNCGRAAVSFTFGLACGLLVAVMLLQLQASREDPELRFFSSVHNLIQRDFVQPLDSREVLDQALRGMVDNLDPYSHYYSSEEVTQLNRETSGQYVGIGVVFKVPIQERVVLYSMPDSPAQRAGIQVGDKLISIDGLPLSDFTSSELLAYVQAHAQDELEFELTDRQGMTRSTSLKPEPMTDPTVRHTRMLDAERGIGYLAVVSFSHRTPEEFDSAIETLAGEGLKSLVLDLRATPGGVLDSAIALANRFIPEGPLVVTSSRNGSHVYRADAALAKLEHLPLVVLVDSGSASASEVLAGAIQDYRAGAIAGEPTFGKGKVQTVEPFSEFGAKVKLTTALYYTPSLRSIDRDHASECTAGIDPDLYLPIEPDVRARIHRFLASYDPPASALDELGRWELEAGISLTPQIPDDPQLNAAVSLLSGEMSGKLGGEPE